VAKFNIERIGDIINLARQLAVGLRDLTFGDNFKSDELTLTIAATSEAQGRHSLKTTPTRYIIVEQTGNGLITKGTTAWTDNFVYFYNNGATSVTIKVVILK
jgi:hypothetical protein